MTQKSDGEKADKFAAELTELCCKHGIGIEDAPRLFVMERDDYMFGYAVRKDGRIARE